LQTPSNFRLLVVRLGAMGDILHALPAVTALRKAHPEWVIDWVVEPRWRALLAAEPATTGEIPQELKPGSSHCPSDGTAKAEPFRGDRGSAQPLVDRLHLAPTKEWRRTPLSLKTFYEIRALRRALRDGEYDAVLDLQGAIRSAMVGRLPGCRRLIGEAEPRERIARWLFTEHVATRGAHVIEQDVELASAVAGDTLSPAAPWLPVDVAAEAWVGESVPALSTSRAVLINPGAGWGAKCWPAERYAEVAKGLADRGLHVLVNAGPGEEALADAIVKGSGGAAAQLSCSLAQLIALTRRIALCIAGDTGPLHLACALGRPVVGIYGPTDPTRNGPFGTRFRVLRSSESRRDHTRRAEPEAGLLTIQPEDVLHAAGELLGEETCS
jgi:heptosyltransferase I